MLWTGLSVPSVCVCSGQVCLFLVFVYIKDMSVFLFLFFFFKSRTVPSVPAVFVCVCSSIVHIIRTCLQFSYARAGLSVFSFPTQGQVCLASVIRFRTKRLVRLASVFGFCMQGQVCRSPHCSHATGRSVSPFSVRVLRVAPFCVFMPWAGFLSLQSAYN